MEDEKKIKELRKKINKIDDKLLRLFEKRFDVSEKIGKHKENLGLPLKNDNREREIVKNKIENTNLSRDFVKKLYKDIFDESIRIQKG